MQYALIKNDTVAQYPYSETQFRRDNPRTSFPKKMKLPVDAQNGTLVGVTKTDHPTVDHTKNVTEGTPVLINGTWTQVWETTDATVEEITERTEWASNNVRSQRNNLLADSDWTVLDDSPLTAEQTANFVIYRQALRDITSHANFPWLDDADWPVKPE